MNTTLKKRRGPIGMESLLACAAVIALRPDKFGAEDDLPPAAKSFCFIKYFEDGDAGVGIGSSSTITDGTKKAPDGKKVMTKEGGDKGFYSDGRPMKSCEYGGVRSKKVEIDGKAPLALLAADWVSGLRTLAAARP